MSLKKDVQRIDKARLVGSISRTDEGFLKGTATVARSGILEYVENGKTVRELIRPEELAKADSIKTLEMKPITNDHPSVKLITPQNYKQFAVGHTGDRIDCDGAVLQASVIVSDSSAISDVEARGKRELSCGYVCDLKEEPGIFEGQRYDREQLNRRYNHVAICDLGRAGAIASLHLDAADVYEVGTPDFKEQKKTDNSPLKRSRPMPVIIKIDGIDYPEQAPEVQKHIEKQDAKIADLTKQVSDATAAGKTKADAQDAEITALKAQIVKKDADIAALPGRITEAAKARAELVKSASPHLDKADVDKIDTLSDGAIRKAIALKAFSTNEQVKPKLDAMKEDDAGLMTWYDAAMSVLAVSHNDSVMAANRAAATGEVKNDGCGANMKTKEDAETEVTTRWRKGSNRDALMK
jgi:hypothetical protein